MLYQKYYAALLHYALRLSDGDRQHAEDVTQEALFRAWQHADALEADEALRWLYTVARNVAISMLHRGRRHRIIEVEFDQDGTNTSDDELERVLESWQVIEALKTLTDNHRAVLVELFYRRRSMVEAAEVLKVPVGTVKSRSHYALRALRDALSERGVITP
ncbi:MAG: sigma-70 family RNA polymerase sigma factor [Streptosporangiales bacterium]|nr:sigma-70 family RNA polymerase sigma factor [Streptosporangiales bacterium]